MTALGEIVIIGGGCYGRFYTEQLEIARGRNLVTYSTLLVVDRDPACQVASLPDTPFRRLVCQEWEAFVDEWLVAADRDRNGLIDMIVPSPFMPHLMANWLLRRAREHWPDRDIAMVPAELPLGTPYDRLHEDGTRYVSHADWLCPTHCIEPLLCPAIHAPRTWEMGETVAAWVGAQPTGHHMAGPALFTCRHTVHGVGMYPANRAFEGLAMLEQVGSRAEGGDLVVGSVSACHGAVGVIRVESGEQRAEKGER